MILHICINFANLHRLQLSSSQSDKMVMEAVKRHDKRKKLGISVELNILRKFIENLGNA